MLLFAGCQNSTALNSLHCPVPLDPGLEVNFVDVCGFDTRRGSPELQQVRLPVRFSLRRLRFSPRTRTSVLLYSDTVRSPGDISIRLGRTNALCAADEGKSASGTYHPKTEGCTRR